MKKILRDLTGYIVIAPFILCIKVLSVFSTREKAIALMSPLVIKAAKRFVRILVPYVKRASDFDEFKKTITSRAPKLWLFYDITFSESENLLKLHVANCPFAEIAKRLGYADLGPIMCHSDWEVAKDNFDKWDFERKHSIGEGDSFCDHTYKRKLIQRVKEGTNCSRGCGLSPCWFIICPESAPLSKSVI